MNALWKNIPAKEPLSLGKLRILFQHLLQGYERVSVVDRKRTKNTFEECVLGIEEDPYYRSMTRGSSAGIPYKIDLAKVGLKGKQILFGVKEKFDLDTHGCHVLRKDVEDEIKYIKRGKKHIIPYEVSEKDECLPREKVLEGKIRLFAVNSALAGVLKRMYGGQFRSWFAHNRIYNGSAIGINVYSKDWDFMCKHLLFGKEENLKPQFIAMDVSKFDGTVSRPWMYNFYQIVCDWYGFSSEERKIQMEIFESQMHSFHIFKGKLFERVGSQSSGDEYTALLNTVLSQAYAYYAISLLINGSNNSIIHCEDFEFLHMLEDISRNVRIIALGDDIVISVRESWYWYDTVNEENLIKVYNKFGVNATTDSKDGSVYKHRYLKDITFLKRKTYYCKQMKRYIGKLDVSSIMKSVQWMRDNDPHYESYRLTLQHALEELALHEDPVFDRYVAQIRERGRERVHLNLLSYDKQWLKRACLLREDYF
nr:non-structural polyprotein [Flumine dicistrovirus 35]